MRVIALIRATTILIRCEKGVGMREMKEEREEGIGVEKQGERWRRGE